MIVSYVYKITNKITNQFYIGSRYRNINEKRSTESDLWIYYFTSSKDVTDLINLYGKESFNLEFVFYGNDNINDDATYWVEQELIRENINDALCLNRQYQDRELGQQKFLLAGTESHRKGKKKGISPKKGKIFGKTKKNAHKIMCPHCNRSMSKYYIDRYHFNLCKMINTDNNLP